MSETSLKAFRSAILASGLLTRDELQHAFESIITLPDGSTLSAKSVTDDQLAEHLLQADLLTAYQIDQLKAGRTKLNLGPYIITDWIGQGGMGRVYKGTHQVLGRESAIKVLPQSKSTPEAIASFTREIRTQARLDHHNLVRAYDAGHDGNVHYLVTEYVPGTDLRRLVRSQGPLTIQQAASIVRQAALALEYAHQRGLIHRDVKPGNILVTPDGVAKVSDLGLSAVMNEEDPRAGKIVGTADYLSPEQIRTPLEVTTVADIYSLGCTLYYAITSKVPFPGGTTAEKARRQLEETPWHPRRFNPDLNEEFVEIIADMMEKEPATRIQSAAEVAARLETWAEDASPIPADPMSKSPWLPPPLPTGEDVDSELQDTDPGDHDELRLGESGSFGESQNTSAIRSARQDTHAAPGNTQMNKPPPLASSPASRTAQTRQNEAFRMGVIVALAISTPICFVVGALVGFLMSLLWTG